MPSLEDLAQWCSKNVGERKAYIAKSNQVLIAGAGWEIVSTSQGWYNVIIYDDHLRLLFTLKFGLEAKEKLP